MKTDSGNLRAGLPAAPEIRFQKRDRYQIHDVIVPVSGNTEFFIPGSIQYENDNGDSPQLVFKNSFT